MTIEEIGNLVAQRLLQGSMNHEEFSNYYHFLGLEGYKCCHKYHFIEQTMNYKQFVDYYISQHDKLIPKFSLEGLTLVKIVPDNWYGYTRVDMDTQTRRNAVKSGLQKYVQWEKDTKKFLEDMIKESTMIGEYGLAEKLKECLKNVEEEVKIAQKEHLEIRSTDYDLTAIVERQKELKKQYGKKFDRLYHNKEKKEKDDDD